MLPLTFPGTVVALPGTRPKFRACCWATARRWDGVQTRAPMGPAPDRVGGDANVWNLGGTEAPAQPAIGVSRIRPHATSGGAEIDAPAGVAQSGVGGVRIAWGAGDHAAPAQAAIGVSRIRPHATSDGAEIDAPAGVAPGGSGGVGIARGAADHAACTQAAIDVLRIRPHATSDGAEIAVPAAWRQAESVASGLPGAQGTTRSPPRRQSAFCG
jgi:hypothetical protein